MFCTRCGREARPGAGFCSGCGAPLAGRARPLVPAPPPATAPAPGRRGFFSSAAGIVTIVVACLLVVAIAATVTVLAVRRTPQHDGKPKPRVTIPRGDDADHDDSGNAGLQSNTVAFNIEFDVTTTGDCNKFQLVMVVPKSIPRRQEVTDVTYSQQPTRVFDRGDTRYAEFVVEDPPDNFTIGVLGKAKIFRYDLETAKEVKPAGDGGDTSRYLESEQYVEKDDPEVLSVAEGIHGDGDLETVREIFNAVAGRLNYSGYHPNDVGAAQTLKSGEGDCTDYTDVLLALCRAKGIPAKFAEGYVVKEGVDVPKHDWAEVYVKGYGWVPFDVLWTDNGAATFEELEPVRLRFSDVRNDQDLEGYHFWYYNYWGGSADVKDNVTFTPVSD